MTDIKTDHHIKISQLIADLQKVIDEHGDIDVVVCKSTGGDYEYSPFSGLYSGYYLPDSTWCGEFAYDNDVRDDPEYYAHYAEEGVRALALYSVH